LRETPLAPGLQAMLAAAARIYISGDVLTERPALAMNFLMDRDAVLRNEDIAKLKAELGACAAPSSPSSDTAMSGSFELACERGTLKISLTLAPASPPTLQKLEFSK
jgi:serine-type D-Ala-D-Ala carboxypeptidase/endopeptidase